MFRQIEKDERLELEQLGRLVIRPILIPNDRLRGARHEIFFAKKAGHGENACVFTAKITALKNLLVFSDLKVHFRLGNKDYSLDEPMLYFLLEMLFKEIEKWLANLSYGCVIIFSKLKHFTEVAVENGWEIMSPSVTSNHYKARKFLRGN